MQCTPPVLREQHGQEIARNHTGNSVVRSDDMRFTSEAPSQVPTNANGTEEEIP